MILLLYFTVTSLFIFLITILYSEIKPKEYNNYGLYFYHLWSCNYDRYYPSEYRSQSLEDKILYETYFKYPTPYLNGFFIEIGALDGLKYSNSYFFEKSLGWKGLLIEGSSSNCKKLKKNQNVRNRSEIICAAVCDKDFASFIERDAMGGVENELPFRPLVNFTTSKKTIMNCIKLSSVIKYYGITHIDVFFLDIEGSELIAIKSFDFKIKVNYWIIEFNNKSLTEHKKIISILNKNGYKDCNIFIGKKNRCFVNKNYKNNIISLKEAESKYYNKNGRKCVT